MPKHVCIDPHDPYAQREVHVEFERIGSGFRLIAAIDDCRDDILPDLIDAQRDDLIREISEADQVVVRRVRAAFSGDAARRLAPC